MNDAAFEAILRIATPLLLAALGELVLERAGVINIGIEGVMLSGAFFGFLASWQSGSPLIGAAAGMLAGAALMAVFGVIVLKFAADQIVAGMALNFLALGITGTANLALTQSAGRVQSAVFAPLNDAWRHAPVLGPLLFGQTALTLTALLLVPLIWFYLEKSERGLELRAVGENPAAAEASGVYVLLCRWKACIAAGVLGGLGGAFLTISQTASYADNCTHGRGFVALAAVVLGRYSAWGCAAACVFFGASFYARDAFPGTRVPTDLVELLPYVLTLVALCIKFRSNGAPAALGKPYLR
jgi:general nucleoside transport system permease protein